MLLFRLLFTITIHQMVMVNGSKILMMPVYHWSHLNMFFIAGKQIQSDGHDVTMLIPEKFEKKVEKSNLNTLVYKVHENANFLNAFDEIAVDLFTGKAGHLTMVKAMTHNFNNWADDMLSNSSLIEEIIKLKFDLAIVDGFPASRFYYAMLYKAGIKYITLTAVHDPWAAGVTALPSVEPGQLLQVDANMSFFDRIKNIISYLAITNSATMVLNMRDTSQYVPEKPTKSLSELYAHSEMFMVNLETNCFDFPRVSAPHYKYIAGASAHAPEPLPADIAKQVDEAKNGIVVVTFGSIKSLRKVALLFMDKLLNAFERLEQTVFIAFNREMLSQYRIPKNVVVLDWLPQNDMLGHEKTKLFVTHSGNNGQLESLFHGVPMLGVPFDGDQKYNALRSKYRGYGETIDIRDFSADEMYNKMKAIINIPSYSKNIKKCSKIVKSMPTPQETLLFWINHILEFGGSHLQPVSIDMPIYKILMLDIFVFFGIILYIMYKVTSLLSSLCYRKCCKLGVKVKTE